MNNHTTHISNKENEYAISHNIYKYNYIYIYIYIYIYTINSQVIIIDL